MQDTPVVCYVELGLGAVRQVMLGAQLTILFHGIRKSARWIVPFDSLTGATFTGLLDG